MTRGVSVSGAISFSYAAVQAQHIPEKKVGRTKLNEKTDSIRKKSHSHDKTSRYRGNSPLYDITLITDYREYASIAPLRDVV